MPGRADSLDTILALIGQLETVLAGLRELRGYVGKRVGAEMLEVLIEESEVKLAEVKKKVAN